MANPSLLRAHHALIAMLYANDCPHEEIAWAVNERLSGGRQIIVKSITAYLHRAIKAGEIERRPPRVREAHEFRGKNRKPPEPKPPKKRVRPSRAKPKPPGPPLSATRTCRWPFRCDSPMPLDRWRFCENLALLNHSYCPQHHKRSIVRRQPARVTNYAVPGYLRP